MDIQTKQQIGSILHLEKYAKQGLYDENWCDFKGYAEEITYE